MKPAYWIGILAIVGGILGYAVSKATTWFGAGIGVVVGILIGALVYLALANRGWVRRFFPHTLDNSLLIRFHAASSAYD